MRYDTPAPRSKQGKRLAAFYLRLFGCDDLFCRTNWDLDPIRWQMRNEIKTAAKVAKHIREQA